MARLFTDEQLLSIFREQGFEDSQGNWQRVSIEEQDNWQDEGKSSSCYIVFKFEESYYEFTVYRYGSYFSHYEFEVWDDASKVELQVYEKTITVRKWVAV